jgi:hypothetical protein
VVSASIVDSDASPSTVGSVIVDSAAHSVVDDRGYGSAPSYRSPRIANW